jgi:hypothetical protein
MSADGRLPDDANGDVLRRMAADGADLVSPRVVDFEHCFPDEASARRFCEAVRAGVSDVNLKPPDGDRGRWEARCRVRMIPTYGSITRTERSLAAAAESFGGYADGWGTLSRPDGSPAE